MGKRTNIAIHLALIWVVLVLFVVLVSIAFEALGSLLSDEPIFSPEPDVRQVHNGEVCGFYNNFNELGFNKQIKVCVR